MDQLYHQACVFKASHYLRDPVPLYEGVDIFILFKVLGAILKILLLSALIIEQRNGPRPHTLCDSPLVLMGSCISFQLASQMLKSAEQVTGSIRPLHCARIPHSSLVQVG